MERRAFLAGQRAGRAEAEGFAAGRAEVERDRYGGRGRGRGRGAGGSDRDFDRNGRIARCWRSEDIHRIVRTERLSAVNAATALSRLAKQAGRNGAGDTVAGSDADWTTMRSVVESVADEFGPRELTNALHGYARLVKCGLDARHVPGERLAALVARDANALNERDVSNALWAYGTMGGIETAALDALDAAARRTAAYMTEARHVGTVLWAFARLDAPPAKPTLEALFMAAERSANDMDAPAVANALWGLAVLGARPAKSTLNALEAAALREAPKMRATPVSQALFAFAKLGHAPAPRTRAALDEAARREGGALNGENTANILYAYASLGDPKPPEATVEALRAAVERNADTMDKAVLDAIDKVSAAPAPAGDPADTAAPTAT